MSLYNGFWPNFGRVVRARWQALPQMLREKPSRQISLQPMRVRALSRKLAWPIALFSQVPRVTIVFIVMEQLKKTFG